VARGPRARTAPDGLVVVDKPAGMTSHDVVSRVRRIIGTRKVGHAGTLDPMATGVLVLGIERATRLLGHLALTDKSYDATIRLGRATVTDDAEGDETSAHDASGVTRDAIDAALAPLRGEIEQRPSSVSAVKVDGVRSYTRVRAGEDVELPTRRVTVTRLEVLDVRHPEVDGLPVVDLDVTVECSSGTYVRAIARDLGDALGVGGHLTALRRTRVGTFGLDVARALEDLEAAPSVLPMADAVSSAFARVDVDAVTAAKILTGARIDAGGRDSGLVGVFGPDGAVLSLAEPRDGLLVPAVVFSS
jgi:tRNA pseudouridine55 synthase